jgi:hypothetical protein
MGYAASATRRTLRVGNKVGNTPTISSSSRPRSDTLIHAPPVRGRTPFAYATRARALAWDQETECS